MHHIDFMTFANYLLAAFLIATGFVLSIVCLRYFVVRISKNDDPMRSALVITTMALASFCFFVAGFTAISNLSQDPESDAYSNRFVSS